MHGQLDRKFRHPFGYGLRNRGRDGSRYNGQAGGFLGKAHDPFALMADPSQKDFKVPDLLPPDQIGAARLDRRRKMRDIVESSVKAFEASEDARLLDENFSAAFRMMTSEQARSAFDLTKEPQSVRERYGMNRFGQCCLLARRLVESGVRFVTVNYGSWDCHVDVKRSTLDQMPALDHGIEVIVSDKDNRAFELEGLGQTLGRLLIDQRTFRDIRNHTTIGSVARGLEQVNGGVIEKHLVGVVPSR